MPNYDYFCKKNGKTVEVNHDVDTKLKTWGEVCFVGQISLGDTDALAPVRLVINPPSISIPTSNSELKEVGFTEDELQSFAHGAWQRVFNSVEC